MTTVYFATSNAGKASSMAEHLKDLDLKVCQVSLDLIEPQANTVEEIALSKAKQAFEQLKEPVVVQDSAFCIDELNGYPGPYIKYTLETIGIKGILQLANNLKSRRCHFVSALVYVDAAGTTKVFTEKGAAGLLATTPGPENNDKAWSELWRIFVPHGANNPLSALKPAEQKAVWAAWEKQSNFTEFGKWLCK